MQTGDIWSVYVDTKQQLGTGMSGAVYKIRHRQVPYFDPCVH